MFIITNILDAWYVRGCMTHINNVLPATKKANLDMCDRYHSLLCTFRGRFNYEDAIIALTLAMLKNPNNSDLIHLTQASRYAMAQVDRNPHTKLADEFIQALNTWSAWVEDTHTRLYA